MNFPRIYSLSTVGILKHYVHDYLFHPLRTDFIGPNGVGKSIIADLLQLLFVYDTSIIKFGTDGVKTDERSIYSLPYKLGTGYCFLNVEIQEGKFLIIGIAISSQISQRIVPFVITRGPELAGEFDQLYLQKEALLTATAFVQEDKVLDLKNLSALLLQKRKLYLTAFRNKEEVKRYYHFLYDKGVLSINLAVDENLNAFAKVIQSFSKAKTLDLNPAKASRSLKEFLFEEADEDFKEEYFKQQGYLERLLREFADLSKFIQLLTSKQKQLVRLKTLDNEQQHRFRQWKATEIHVLHTAVNELNTKEHHFQEKLEAEKKNKHVNERNMFRLPAINQTLEQAKIKANGNLEDYNSYEQCARKIDNLEEDITALKLLQLKAAGKKWKDAIGLVDITIRDVGEYKEMIPLFLVYQSNYKTFEEVEAKYSLQQQNVIDLRTKLHSRKTSLNTLLQILKQQNGHSVLGWALQQQLNLSLEQQNLIIHFATAKTNRPTNPKKDDYYVEPERLLASNIEPANDENGFWIELGAIRQWINNETIEHAGLNGNTNIQYLQSKAEEELKQLLSIEKELDLATKGKSYDRLILDRDYDLFLMQYLNIEKLKEAAGYALSVESKVKQLEEEKANAVLQRNEIKRKLPQNILYDEPEVILKELKRISDRVQNRIRKLDKHSNKLEFSLQQTEDNIRLLQQELIDITSQLLAQQKAMADLQSAYFQLFQENLELAHFERTNIQLQSLEQEFKSAKLNYELHYRETTGTFDETKDGASILVNEQITTGNFDFYVLERVLLGTKIKHTDDIASALADANNARLAMADDLKHSMIKIFDTTLHRYRRYNDLVFNVNTFFQGRRISERFFFSIKFTKNTHLKIDLVEEIGSRVRNAARQGELPFDKPVSEFVEEFFQKAARLKEKVTIDKLLNPKSYFDLSVSLTDETGTDIPGSTGETYSAIALLGIARLSIVQKEKKKGLRFIILEELGSLDSSNFNTFPAIAKEFDYQIITMAPTPFRTDLADEWYAHHLIKGKENKDINHYPSASYFRTKAGNDDLLTYLKLRKNELDRAQGIA